MVDIVRALFSQDEQKAPARKAKKGKKRKVKQASKIKNGKKRKVKQASKIKNDEIADMLKRLSDLESKLSSSEEE